MVVTLLIVNSDVFSQVRGTTWGDSWEQVEETIDESPINAYESVLLELFDLSVIELSSRLKTHNSFQLTNGDETGVIYGFLDEKLALIGVNFIEPLLTLYEYDNISGSLSRKYGEYQDEMMDWYDESYDEDNLDLAIQEGALTITRVWEDNLTYIEFYIGNDGEGGTHMLIRYMSQQYYDDLMAEWDRIEMNDF